MNKCEDCEEITSILIGMRNYYLLVDFWTRASPKRTNLVRTRHTAHWDLARNPRSQRAGGLIVGVKNGYDEVNVQIPEEEKCKNLLRQILLRNRFCFTKSFAEETRVIGQELEKGRYAATERVFRSVVALQPSSSQSSVAT
ncbi:hypothetical protein DY000_02021858 [Brassica cretica]|uniref:Uncharacterized protein n=1 Tax=Brassica cretica TaxID=69181 RepID=A0ABQ7E8G8_BRACR|nr:hypothetical protein DY000_02021858 [Brassica cretica]